jgi:hypothetical protein
MADQLETLYQDLDKALKPSDQGGDQRPLAHFMDELLKLKPAEILAMQLAMEHRKDYPQLGQLFIVNFDATADSARQITVGAKQPNGNQLFATTDVHSSVDLVDNEPAYVSVGPKPSKWTHIR